MGSSEQVEIERLKAAIRNHRDQRGDDRCWEDDRNRYAALGEPIPPDATALPPKDEFLKSCERYYEQRRCPLDCYPPDKMRIAELEATIRGLQSQWNHWAVGRENLRGKLSDAIDAWLLSPTFGTTDISNGSDFQSRVLPWLHACFGPEIASDRTERNHRFIEEALELVQACGATRDECLSLVDYVYDRPIGEIPQEVGGVMVTLAALCLANGISMHEAGETELSRILTKIEAIRAKQAAKPKGSVLPALAGQAQIDIPSRVKIVLARSSKISDGYFNLADMVKTKVGVELGLLFGIGSIGIIMSIGEMDEERPLKVNIFGFGCFLFKPNEIEKYNP